MIIFEYYEAYIVVQCIHLIAGTLSLKRKNKKLNKIKQSKTSNKINYLSDTHSGILSQTVNFNRYFFKQISFKLMDDFIYPRND